MLSFARRLRRFQMHLLCRRSSQSVLRCFSCQPDIEDQSSNLKQKPVFIPPKSSLVVSGPAAQFVTFVVDPYLDVHGLLKDEAALEKDIAARKIDIDIPSILRLWSDLQTLCSERDGIMAKRDELKCRVSKEVLEPEDDQLLAKTLFQNWKNLSAKISSQEAEFALKVLDIPVLLHPKTPRNGCQEILFENIHPVLENCLYEKERGCWNELVEYNSSCLSGYFLRGPAAELELMLLAYFEDRLEALGFSPLSGPHLFKAVVLEGSAIPFAKANDAFMINDDNNLGSCFKAMFLTNDALNVFAGYFANSETDKKILPVRMQSSGRIYRPKPHQNHPGPHLLLEPIQTHSVGFCIACGEESETDSLAKEMVENLRKMYVDFNLPFRLITVPADQLRKHESIRYSLQLFSPSQKRYFSCGSVSVSEDHFSKRLRCHVGKSQARKFLKFVHGSAIELTPFLACSIENLWNCGKDDWFTQMKSKL